MTDASFLEPAEAISPAPSLRQRATAILPMVRPAMRYVPKNPMFLIGAAALGIAGFVAWKNRDRIAAKAGPMLQNAAAKGQELKDMAMEKGAELTQRLPFGKEAPPPSEPAFH